MAMKVMMKYWLLVLVLINFTFFNCKLGKAEKDYPEDGGATTGPGQTVAKALQCFNNNYIYSSCESSYRLTESGCLNVLPEHTDEYCNGPCQTETHLVLDCIGNMFVHFEFYNKATIEDVGDTIKAGCGHGSQRGNFDVTQHLNAEESHADKIVIRGLFVVMLILSFQCLFFQELDFVRIW